MEAYGWHTDSYGCLQRPVETVWRATEASPGGCWAFLGRLLALFNSYIRSAGTVVLGIGTANQTRNDGWLLEPQTFFEHKLKEMKNGKINVSEFKLRLFSEAATLFLISIVFIATLKNNISWIYATLYFFIISVILMFLVRLYKKYILKK